MLELSLDSLEVHSLHLMVYFAAILVIAAVATRSLIQKRKKKKNRPTDFEQAIPNRVRVHPQYFPRKERNIEIPPMTVNTGVAGNDPNHNVILPPLRLKKSTIPNAGLGLFANSPDATERGVVNAIPAIRAGEMISEYGGKKLNRKQANDLRQKVREFKYVLQILYVLFCRVYVLCLCLT
jgi:hypothetical protein